MASKNKQGNEKREALADILAEIRDALRNENPWGENDTRTAWINSGSILAYLDRIETAWKREREAVEADALAVGGIVEASRHKPGNAAAMREALETIHDKVNGLDEECGVDPVEIRDLARAAISAPPRQCDVGTAEEHAQRFYNFCESNSSGINGMCKPTCPCIDCFDKCQCFAKWAQMPYEDEEGGAK